MRKNQGKHVIPVPVMEIKRTFSGYFLDPFSVFRKTSSNDECEEKTIVRPTYSYMGDFIINDTALCEIAKYEASRIPGVHSIQKISIDETDNGAVFNIDITVDYGIRIKDCSFEISDAIKQSLEKHASIYTDAVNITVKSINI